MDERDSSPQTTLVILLGASQWPEFPDFHGSQAFVHVAADFSCYLLDQEQFGLPSENFLNLFDTDLSPDKIDKEIRHFLDRRTSEMKQVGNNPRDLLFYFVGHGGFIGRNSEYYLAVRCTSSANPAVSGIRMEPLATTITNRARYLRRLVILDCCYAAAAFTAFQAEGPAQMAIRQTVDVFKEKAKRVGKGTALLCSSGKKVPSLLTAEEDSTMFSRALLHVLSTRGNPYRPDEAYLSLREVADLTEEVLDSLFEEKAPRPELHSPDQVDGDVADVPFFPNPVVKTIEASQGREVLPIQEEIIPPSQLLSVPERLPEPPMTGERNDAIGARLIAPAGWGGATSHDEPAPTLAPTARLADIGVTSIPTWPPNRSSQPDKTASPFGWPDQPHKTTPLPFTPSGRWHQRRARGQRKNIVFPIILFLAAAVLLTMFGVFAFQLLMLPTVSIHFSPQTHLVSQVFHLTASTSVTGVDVGSRSIPARILSKSETSSQNGPTSGQSCANSSTCQPGVSAADVNSLAGQIRPNLEFQIAHDLQTQLHNLGATALGTDQFSYATPTSKPTVGSPGTSVAVMLTGQGSVGYFLNKDAQTLTRQLLLQQMQTYGANYVPVDSTIRIGQPIVTIVGFGEAITINVPAAGYVEYQFSQVQLDQIKDQIKGKTVSSARSFIAIQAGIDPRTITIRFRSAGSNRIPSSSDTLSGDPQRIALIADSVTLPPVQLPSGGPFFP